MERTIRVQGAIIREHHLLLIKHQEHRSGRAYWLLPGGGIEADETEEICLRRELKEETHLDVAVERLLFDEPNPTGGVYRTLKTYLCTMLSGEARPGHEPEAEVADVYAITAVQWIDLRDEAGWPPEAIADPWTYPLLKRIRQTLGYT